MTPDQHGSKAPTSNESGIPMYPATPVDCLISELRDAFEIGVLTRDEFEKRVAQFRREVEHDI